MLTLKIQACLVCLRVLTWQSKWPQLTQYTISLFRIFSSIHLSGYLQRHRSFRWWPVSFYIFLLVMNEIWFAFFVDTIALKVFCLQNKWLSTFRFFFPRCLCEKSTEFYNLFAFDTLLPLSVTLGSLPTGCPLFYIYFIIANILLRFLYSFDDMHNGVSFLLYARVMLLIFRIPNPATSIGHSGVNIVWLLWFVFSINFISSHNKFTFPTWCNWRCH